MEVQARLKPGRRPFRPSPTAPDGQLATDEPLKTRLTTKNTGHFWDNRWQ